MSSSSIARQNRRMRLKQLPALTIDAQTPPKCSLNLKLHEFPNYPSGSTHSTTEDMNCDSYKSVAAFPSNTSCSVINCDVSSRPIEKLFIEDGRGFKVIEVNHMHLPEGNCLENSCLKTELAIALAYKATKMFQNFSHLCHGLLGGMSLLHLLLFLHFINAELSTEEIIKYSSFLSQPVHNIYNFLCVICCISSFDRYDIANIQNALKYVKKHYLNACIIILYPVCLLMSLSTVTVDEKFWLSNTNFTKWEAFTQKDISNEIFYWKTLSILKCAGVILAWILLCMDPYHNLFLYRLKNIYDKNKDIN